MKRTGFALALLVFAFLPYTSFAQSMYPNYSSYQTVTANSTTIMVSVTVDGSTSGSLCGQYGCIPTPTHTPSVYNSLKNTTTGAVTGGWQTGPGVTWNSYLSQTNNQSVPKSSNVSFDLSSVTQIICSAVGSFYFFQFPNVYVGSADTKEKTTVPGQNTWCTSAPICANTANPRCKVSSIYEGSNQPCHAAHWCDFITTSPSGTAPYSCYLINCNGAIDTTPGICTPQ
jgi:hypothetical protein